MELSILLKFFYLAAVYDQVDLPQLCSAELLARRAQMIELQYKSRFSLGTGGGGGGAKNKNDKDNFQAVLDDSHLYLGLSATRGLLCVSPDLEKYVGKQLGEEYLAIKERRKALEAAKS